MTDTKPLTAEEKQVLLSELSAAELAKQINDDWGLMQAAERTKLQRAKALGEKLVAFRDRTDHGDWQWKLKKWCPTISYETANRYIKLYVKWVVIEKAATAKNVKLTDLTIDEALKLLAKPPDPNKPKPETDTDGNPRKSKSAELGAVAQPPTSRNEDIAKQYLWEVWAPDELVSVLREVRDDEYLRQLHAALAKALQPKPTTAMPKPEGEVVRRM